LFLAGLARRDNHEPSGRCESLPVSARGLGWQDQPRPILFIHGEHDPYLPMIEFRELTRAAAEPKQVWSVSQAGHRNVDDWFPEQYLARVIRFLDQYLRQ